MGFGTTSRHIISSSQYEDEGETSRSSKPFSLLLSDSSEEDGDGQEMEIYLKVIKTVSLKVKKEYKISDVKAKFQDVGGLPPCLQRLIYADEPLENEKTLTDLGISTGSTVHLFLHPGTKMRISIMNPYIKKTLKIDVMPWDLIQNVKAKIYSRTRTPVSDQNILYNGVLLENQRTLAEYEVKDESVLVLIQVATDMKVYASIPNRKQITLEVKKYFTLFNVRQIAESMWRTSLYEHCIINNGVSLGLHQTLEQCHVEEYSTFRFVVPMPLNIYVDTGLGKTLRFRVKSSDTITQVLEKIELELGNYTNKLRLVFSGRELLDDEVLAECGVRGGSTLQMVILKEMIIVRSMTRKELVIGFKSNDTVGTIQRKIKLKQGIPIDQQRLIFNLRCLEYHRTLASYDVTDGSTIDFILHLRGC